MAKLRLTLNMVEDLKDELRRVSRYPANVFKEDVRLGRFDLSVIRFLCCLPAEEDVPNCALFRNKTVTSKIIKEALKNHKVVKEVYP